MPKRRRRPLPPPVLKKPTLTLEDRIEGLHWGLKQLMFLHWLRLNRLPYLDELLHRTRLLRQQLDHMPPRAADRWQMFQLPTCPLSGCDCNFRHFYGRYYWRLERKA